MFLDAGNTLVSMDFDLIADEMARLGVECEPARLQRAEAAARPAVSARIGAGGSTEGSAVFAFWLGCMLDHALDLRAAPRDALVERLVSVLKAPGMTQRLWSAVLPQVPEALVALRDAGLRLVVVSNSDGSIDAGLRDTGLRPLVDDVVDSAVVGHEKPSPGIFEIALDRAGSAPERTLHVGDTYAADVVGARGAGLHALLLDPYGDWTDVDCPTLPDLMSLARAVGRARSGT